MIPLTEFDYELPDNLIAQTPLEDRSHSRLLVLNREQGQIDHQKFQNIIDFFDTGDVIVLNNSRVMPSRIFGQKLTGAKVELLLLEESSLGRWRALVGGRRLKEGVSLVIHDHSGNPTPVEATIEEVLEGPLRIVTFNQPNNGWLYEYGHIPLPPYIHQKLDNNERYQTIYSRHEGSAAAPTAGLHFTPEILLALRDKGVLIEHVTLHIGLDTFKPVEVDDIQQHTIHTEWASLNPETAERINQAKLAGGKIVAVGTTSMRTLETAALRSAGISGSLANISERDLSGETADVCPWKPVIAYEGKTDLFIYPGYRFRAVDALITNFHMPKSTLMMLVSAFAGREAIQNAYQAAIAEEYRFLSLGDAMFIQ